MKIITNDAVYVQKNDIGFLTQTDLSIPATIFLKVFGSGITIIDDSNRFEFVKFTEQSEIEYFRNLDWIVDYNEVKDLTDDQIMELGRSIADEKNEIAKVFNSMSDEKRRENMQMVVKCETLDFKMYSLRDIIWFRQGHIKMTLPDGKQERKGMRRFLGLFKRHRQG